MVAQVQVAVVILYSSQNQYNNSDTGCNGISSIITGVVVPRWTGDVRRCMCCWVSGHQREQRYRSPTARVEQSVTEGAAKWWPSQHSPASSFLRCCLHSRPLHKRWLMPAWSQRRSSEVWGDTSDSVTSAFREGAVCSVPSCTEHLCGHTGPVYYSG